VVRGYSQGAALTHRAVKDLPQAQKNQIVAAFTFGDTQNKQVRSYSLIFIGLGDCLADMTIGQRTDSELSGGQDHCHLQQGGYGLLWKSDDSGAASRLQAPRARGGGLFDAAAAGGWCSGEEGLIGVLLNSCMKRIREPDFLFYTSLT